MGRNKTLVCRRFCGRDLIMLMTLITVLIGAAAVLGAWGLTKDALAESDSTIK